MKILVILAIIGLAVYGALNYSSLTNMAGLTGGGQSGNPSGQPVDVDSFAGKALEPSALSHCKAHFPGKAHSPEAEKTFFAAGHYASTHTVLSDKQVSYFMSELQVPEPPLSKTAITPDPSQAVALANAKAESMLKESIAAWSKANNVTIGSTMQVHGGGTLAPFLASEVTGYARSESNAVIARFYCDAINNRIYAIAVTGDPKVATKDNVDTAKFLDTLETW